MSVDVRFAGGTVVTPDGAQTADLLVSDGKVSGIVAADVPVEAARTVDVAGKLVLPGFVDVHVHTREPGFTHKEDIRTTTLQAAAGGVTTIFGMPNLMPPTTDVQTLTEVFDLYERTSIVDWNHNPAPTVLEDIEGMAAMGIRA